MKGLVSVIIPTYNRAYLLSEALESVWTQTYRPIELIVVDDASDDDTDQIVEAWRDKHLGQDRLKDFIFKFIRSNINKGPGASRETGRLKASGDYICYLDSDDFWHPEKIKKQVDLLMQNPDAGMCYCLTKVTFTMSFNGSEQLRKGDRPCSTFLPDILLGRPWGTPACMWTRKAADQIGPWFPARIREDFEYEARAGCHDIRIIFLPEALCYCRVRNKSDEFHKNRVLEVSAMLSLAKNLDRFRKLSNHLTNSLLIDFLYNRGFWLFINGYEKPGKDYLHQILCLSTATWRMKLWLRSIFFLINAMKNNLAARLAKKIDPKFFI